MLDLLLQHCRIVDGSGSPWFRGDIAIKDGKIALVKKDISQKAVMTISFEDKIACPGFIDMHTHSDLRLFSQPEEKAKIMQGITTALVGQDGLSVAPLTPEAQPGMRRRLLGLNGEYDGPWPWETVGEYLDAIDKRQPATNTAMLIPHGAVRGSVMGWENRPATEDEMHRMVDLVGASMDEGAFGFSTGLIYPPCLYAREEEMIVLAAESARRGGFFVVHMRNESDHLFQSLEEVIDICTKARSPLHISHLKVAGKRNWGLAERVLERIDRARSEGLDVTFDQYPYTAGSTMLDALIPPPFHDGGQERMLERLKDPAVRREILDIQENRKKLSWENWIDSCGWDGILVNAVEREKNRWAEGKTLAEIASEGGKSHIDALCDLLVEEEGKVTMTEFYGSEEDVRTIMSHGAMLFCSDSIVGGKPHPRAYGSTARILGKYVRDEGVLSLPEAIRKMTSGPASRLGLQDRGLIREGMTADLVVFDDKTVAETGDYMDPVSYPAGMEAVVINGSLVMINGELTEAMPGGALRRTF